MDGLLNKIIIFENRDVPENEDPTVREHNYNSPTYSPTNSAKVQPTIDEDEKKIKAQTIEELADAQLKVTMHLLKKYGNLQVFYDIPKDPTRSGLDAAVNLQLDGDKILISPIDGREFDDALNFKRWNSFEELKDYFKGNRSNCHANEVSQDGFIYRFEFSMIQREGEIYLHNVLAKGTSLPLGVQYVIGYRRGERDVVFGIMQEIKNYMLRQKIISGFHVKKTLNRLRDDKRYGSQYTVSVFLEGFKENGSHEKALKELQRFIEQAVNKHEIHGNSEFTKEKILKSIRLKGLRTIPTGDDLLDAYAQIKKGNYSHEADNRPN